MAALNTCNSGQISYRAYSIYCLVYQTRKGLPTPGLKTKGQGEETVEIILLGGERWLPKASALTLERVGTGFQPDFSAHPTPHSQLARLFCTNTSTLSANQVFHRLLFLIGSCFLSFISREGWEEVMGVVCLEGSRQLLESPWSVTCLYWERRPVEVAPPQSQWDDCFCFLF